MGDWETADLENLRKLFTRFNEGRLVPHTDRKVIRQEDVEKYLLMFLKELNNKLPLGVAAQIQPAPNNCFNVDIFDQKSRRLLQEFDMQWKDNQFTWSYVL